MTISDGHRTHSAPDGYSRPSGFIRRWFGLLLGCLLVWLFMFVVAPSLKESSVIEPLAGFIEESGIDAGALYYTEIEETAEAEMYLRDAGRYVPSGHPE